MKTKKKVILLGMLILLCSLSIGMTAQAKPSRTVINFAFDLNVSGDAERIWETPSGIWQIRNTPHVGSVLSVNQQLSAHFSILEISFFSMICSTLQPLIA